MARAVDFERLCFLIVEDNPHMRSIIRTILMGFGARQIIEAPDGADGLEKLDSFNPDVVILDWEMPVLSGGEMVSLIRRPGHRHAYVPIILLTAHTSRNRITEARDMGVNEVLRKPVSPKSLHQRIASIVLMPRPFIRTATYFGPEPRDAALAEKLMSQQITNETAQGDAVDLDDLSQEELDKLFA